MGWTRVTDGNVAGKRPIGRPRTRWKDVVEKDIKTIHESIRIEDTSDRIRWNDLLVAATDLQGPLSC